MDVTENYCGVSGPVDNAVYTTIVSSKTKTTAWYVNDSCVVW